MQFVEKMKFSIIVPVYNAAHYLSNTLYSLLSQNVRKEIILVNDGSTDDSLAIMREFEKKYPEEVFAYDKKNEGVSSARNYGLDKCTGDYIVFVDSDDTLEVDTLSKCAQILKTHTVQTVFYSYKFVYTKTGTKKIIEFGATGEYNLKDWLRNFVDLNKSSIINCIGTTIYSREIIEKHQLYFNKDISYCEDVSFCTQYLGYIDKLYYINEPLYNYIFVNSNSLMTQYKNRFTESKHYLHQIQLDTFKIHFGNQVPYEQLYSVWASDIVYCVKNIFDHNHVSNSIRVHELARIQQLPYLKACFLKSHSLLCKVYIMILMIFNTKTALWLLKKIC